MTPPLNLPAPGRCQAIFVILTISHSHVFLVNSRLGHFSAPTSLWVPFSRSYGVNLPSSLAVIHSSALGFSPHPPVSVYGTGRVTLSSSMVFSLACFSGAVGSSEDSPYCRGSACDYPASTVYSVRRRPDHSQVPSPTVTRAAESLPLVHHLRLSASA